MLAIFSAVLEICRVTIYVITIYVMHQTTVLIGALNNYRSLRPMLSEGCLSIAAGNCMIILITTPTPPSSPTLALAPPSHAPSCPPCLLFLAILNINITFNSGAASKHTYVAPHY